MLAARGLVRAMDDELARWIGTQMSARPSSREELTDAVLPPVLVRWRCLLDAARTNRITRNVGWVALATLLHKYGLRDEMIIGRAVDAVADLDEAVALSDAFRRRRGEITELLRSVPAPLSRRPRQPRTMTFLRPGDAIAIELDGHFHAAFVLELERGNEFPIIEFYAGRFAKPPAPTELSGLPAARERARARFGVVGLTYLPDPANQVLALAALHPEPPVGGEPQPGDGRWAPTDIFNLQRDMSLLFAE